MQYFTTQLSGHQQTAHSLRASQYRTRKKRRRHAEASDSSSSESEADVVPGNETDIPPSPFPHAPARPVKQQLTGRKLHEEIAKPPSRLYAVDALTKSASIQQKNEATTLRKTHLNVLSTVMHRCLLEGDYERAGRAWGMLLRTRVTGGHYVDPRNHGRWGVGAEILLRREPQTASNHVGSTSIDQHTFTQSTFSPAGFELAREYYERLIVQHPYRKLAPHTVDERTFYPAMFSLWIFEVCEKSNDLRAEEEAIEVEELASATEIAERLDQLVASPPFDKQASLLHLRGHIGLWRGALLLGKTIDDDDWELDTGKSPDENHILTTAEQLSRISNCQRELEQAQQFLKRASWQPTDRCPGASRQPRTYRGHLTTP
ncbi:hypothetical protein IQ06DRAFT_314239 [Phaeosphaeriaceae sp. SRC1lsM3a]|nr:hypothetical protein IQ06DRAFT_314239 [Stagonospora sp. SRC1lsM3a]